MKTNKLLGGVLLVSGTTLGAGLLGVPAACSFMGFYFSLFTFFFVWAAMLAAGIYFVEVTCKLKNNVNLITMAQKMIGKWGQVVSWVTFLLLMYCLLALYISGSVPIFKLLFSSVFGMQVSNFPLKFVLPILLGPVLYMGTKGVDLTNRLLMLGLLVCYGILIFMLPSHVELSNLRHVDIKPVMYALPIVITGFGYQIIIPTLGSYMEYDKAMMKKAIIIGSLVSLAVNMFWIFLVLGSVPFAALVAVEREGVPITSVLANVVDNSFLKTVAYGFSFFAIGTSFVGVGISLIDFLVDGFKITQCWKGKLIAICLTFVPPLVFVTSYERGFMLALGYGGMFVAILLAFIPAVMSLNIQKKFYQSVQGKAIAYTVIAFSVVVVVANILTRYGVFEQFLRVYGGE